MKKIKVGTFNAYNLVLPNTTYYGWKKYSTNDYHKKTAWIGSQLDSMKADIIGFQEVFHRTALEEALDASKHCKDYNIVMSKPSSVENAPRPAPIVALATKFPVLDYHVVENFNELLELDPEVSVPIFQFSRPVLIVELEVYGQMVTVFVVHLKSKRPSIPRDADANDPFEQAKGQTRSLIRRAAEALALR
ncbi:MAG: endonuclease/exonuclease/phosphatase family protein, partial [Chitinophagales bacterium]